MSGSNQSLYVCSFEVWFSETLPAPHFFSLHLFVPSVSIILPHSLGKLLSSKLPAEQICL